MYARILSHLVVSDSLWPPWTVAHLAPLSMGFFRQEYWSGLPFPPPGDLPNPGIEPESPVFPALQMDYLPTKLSGKPPIYCYLNSISIFLGQNKLTSKSCSSFLLLISHSYKMLLHWTKVYCQPFLSALPRNNRCCWHPHTTSSVLIGGQLYPKIFPSVP